MSTPLIERLRAGLSSPPCNADGTYTVGNCSPDVLMFEAAAEIERLRADAARYRWIKRGASFREERDMGPGGCWSIFVAVPRRPAVNTLDAAIDAAMAQGKG